MVFTLNDESVKNSYGYYVDTASIKTERFMSNPVCLADHKPECLEAVGKWGDLKKEGGKLTATLTLDEGDPVGKTLKRKIDGGYLRGCSMGLGMENVVWVKENGKVILKNGELFEASLTPLPSNHNSLRLYNSKGEKISDNEIKLKIKNIEMEKTEQGKLFEDVLTVKESQSETVKLTVEAGQEKARLSALVETLKGQLKEYKAIELVRLKQENEDFVNKAVKEGRIREDGKATYLELLSLDQAKTKAAILSIPEKVELSVTPSSPSVGAVDIESFQKLPVSEQLSIKENDKERYNKILSTIK